MALGKDYGGQRCSLARALEVVGERWTLLIVRDAFFGVRRFGDFADHLDIPRAVLTDRLGSLVEAGVLARQHGDHGHTEYALTDKGVALWPVLRSLLAWGTEYCTDDGPYREFLHAEDGGLVDPAGICAECGGAVSVADLTVVPGKGARPQRDDVVTAVLATPHRMLEPIRG
jgi:DNA-binding HxlR family transcriptional regulator